MINDSRKKIIQNIAVDEEGYYVGWKSDTQQYNVAVHILLEPRLNSPSRCFFYNTMNEAYEAKDYLESRFVDGLQRIEICKVQYEYPCQTS